MTALQFSSEQMQALAHRRARAQMTPLHRQVDSTTAASADPPTRLAALHALVATRTRERSAIGPLLATDVDHAATMLGRGLQAGSTWNEASAAGLLHAAAALGALWFLDDRLLPPEDLLGAGQDEVPVAALLLAPCQPARFRHAARRSQEIVERGAYAMRVALADGFSKHAVAALGHAALGDAGEARQAAFVAKERRLIDAANITDSALQAACMAGDLAFGLGRCVRLLELPSAAAAPLPWLTRTLHELVDRRR